MKAPYHLVVLGVAAGLGACSGPEAYVAPEKPVVENWTVSDTAVFGAGTENAAYWWRALKDDGLNQVMADVAGENIDLKIAVSRLNEAEAVAGGAEAARKPQVTLGANAARSGGALSQGGLDRPDSRAQLGLTGQWDPDLFGSKANEAQSRQAAVYGAKAMCRRAIQLVLSEVARSYVDLREQQQLLALTQRNLGVQQKTLHVVEVQYNARAAAKLDLLRAQGQVSATSAELPSIRAVMAVKRNRIAVLLGKSPQSFAGQFEPAGPVPFFDEKLLLRTPVGVMAGRPDIQAAEFSIQEQLALKNARAADMLPKLSLSAFIGAGTSSLYGSSLPWTLAGDIAGPLFDFGRLQAQVDAADARKQGAIQSYRKSMLGALEEVENALVQYVEQRNRLGLLQQRATAEREASTLARLQYEAGDAGYLDVLIAEERLLGAEYAAVNAKAAATRAGVDLYTAMGVLPPVESGPGQACMMPTQTPLQTQAAVTNTP